jgi:hypothetical protein
VVDVTVTARKGTSPTGSADQFTYEGVAPTVTNVEPKRGINEGGTQVTITGTNLTGATAVKFGSGNATTFAVNSETSISAVSPPGVPGAVNVTVTTAGGTSATTPADEFSYFTLVGTCEEGTPPPIVTNVEPSTGPAGTTVKVKVEHSFEVICGDIGNTIRRMIFGAQEVTFTHGEHEGELVATAPPGTGTVDVRVEMTDDQVSPPFGDKFTYS